MQFYTRYSKPPQVAVSFSHPTMTQQSFKDECDINEIISRAIAGQDETVFSTDQRGAYFDCTTHGDFQYAMDILQTARTDFESLPSKLRAYFGNDLESYVAFMTDPANIEQAQDLGLLPTPAEKPAVTLPVSGAGAPPAGASDQAADGADPSA